MEFQNQPKTMTMTKINLPQYQSWLQEKNLAPTTIRHYLHTLTKFNQTPTPQTLQAYFKDNLKNYDPSTLKVKKYALNSYLKFQKLKVEWERIARLIPKTQRKFYATLNEVELTRLKQTQVEKNPQIYQRNNLILDFLFYSGVRINELIQIQHQDWKQDNLRIHGKGNKVRYIFLPPFLTEYFTNHQGYLFTNQRGNPLKAEYIRWMIKERTHQANLSKNITPHTFRRSFATHLRKRGGQLETIQILLGHSSIQTTEKYLHYDRDSLYADYSRLWKGSSQICCHEKN